MACLPSQNKRHLRFSPTVRQLFETVKRRFGTGRSGLPDWHRLIFFCTTAMCSQASTLFGRVFRVLSQRLGFFSSVHTDLQRHFLNPRVHSLLRKLVSQSDLALVHRPKFRTEKSPSIKLLSDSELQAVKTFSKVLTAQKLQMPPVMNPRVDNLEENIIVRDPNLCGLLPGNQKLVFVDIGLESTRRQRLMVIREADGTLRHANASERDRLNQVYFPLPGRRLRVPSMLRTPNFEATLRSGRHEYILDRLLAQFEPDDPEYIRLCHAVYDDAEARIWSYYNAENTGGSFSTSADETEPTKHVVTRLRYTRHYGPFALYVIASLGRPESLLQEALSHQAFDTAEHILHLTCILQPQSEAAEALNKRHNFPSCLDHENNDESQPLLKRHIERTLELVRVDVGIDFIDSCNSRGSSVYVHCKAGRTRSAFLVACYLMSRYDLSPTESVERIRASRKHILFHDVHMDGLQRYHRILQERRASRTD